ncbi:MAG: DUF2070 family protein [Candidatus Caldarchaeales archaeon]
MVDASGIASKYRFLFRPPGADFAPLLVLATALATALVVELAVLSPTELVVWASWMALLPMAVNLVSSRTVYAGSRVVTLRRLNMLTLLENYFGLAASLAGAGYSVLAQNDQGTWRAYLASVSLSGYVRVTVLAAFEGPLRGYAVGVAEVLVRYLVAAPRPELHHPVAISLAATFFAPAASLAALSAGFSGTTPLRLARGFARTILAGDPGRLERELMLLSERRDFASTAIVFRTASGKRLALVVTDFHFGPFRNVGSSMLNYQVELELSRRGFEALVLKGCAGHDADVADSGSVRRVVAEVADSVAGHAGPPSRTASILPQREVDGVTLVGIEACGRTFVVATLHPMPMEDFPKSLEEPFTGRGVRLIDPHNSFMDGYNGLSDRELSGIRAALDRFLSSSARVTGRPKVALAREVPEDLGPTEGMGPSGMSVFGLEVNGYRLAMAVVDGNNALPEVRPLVLEAVRGEGWDAVEFLTTDTHSVNGVKLGGRGYRTIGESVSAGAVAERLRRLARDALRSLEEAEVSVVEAAHRDVPALSGDALERLSGLTQRSIAVYLALMGSSFLIPLLL